MARTKNTAFSGVSLYRAEPDAPTFRGAIEEAAADMALIYDKLTGKNAEANTIDHSGKTDARGAPLAIPWCNQYMNAWIRYYQITGSGGTKNSDTGQTAIACLPFFWPDSENDFYRSMCVEIDMTINTHNDGMRPWFQIMNSAGTLVMTGDMQTTEDLDALRADGVGSVAGTWSGHTTASLLSPSNQPLYLFICVNTDHLYQYADADGTTHAIYLVKGVRVFVDRIRSAPIPATTRKLDDDIGVTAPSSTQEMAWRDFYDGYFGTAYAYNAYLTAGINRNANAVHEFLTGWPAGNDASYTQVDHDGGGAPDDINPARSRFHAGTRSLAGMSAEPLPQFPLFSESLGGVLLNGYAVVNDYSSGAQIGCIDLQPIIANRKTRTTVHRCFTSYPDFPTGASSNLKWVVLASFSLDPSNASGNGPSQWTAYVGTGSGTGTSTFTRIGTTSFAYASGTALDFPADQQGTVTLEIEKTGAGAKAAVDEIQLLGWSLYFEP